MSSGQVPISRTSLRKPQFFKDNDNSEPKNSTMSSLCHASQKVNVHIFTYFVLFPTEEAYLRLAMQLFAR